MPRHPAIYRIVPRGLGHVVAELEKEGLFKRLLGNLMVFIRVAVVWMRNVPTGLDV